jgi:hypothetical protein
MVWQFFSDTPTSPLLLAELDKYKKAAVSRSPSEGSAQLIPRPAKVTKLVNDMQLTDQKDLYNQCRVSVTVVFGSLVLIIAAPRQGQDEKLWNPVLDALQRH